jgi:hypothetical protein
MFACEPIAEADTTLMYGLAAPLAAPVALSAGCGASGPDLVAEFAGSAAIRMTSKVFPKTRGFSPPIDTTDTYTAQCH